METNQENKAPETEVNLDALSAPEGSYDPFIHGDGSGNDGVGGDQIPGGSGIPDNLPNLDDDPNNTAEPNGGDPNPDPNAGDPNPDPNADPNLDPNNNPDPNPGDNNQQPQDQGEYWMKPFEQLKAANPEWEIPDGITEENYLAVLQDTLKPQQRELHPELLRIQEALDSGMDFQQVMQQTAKAADFNSLTDRELLAMNYKQTYKDWDDAKVKETLDKLDNAGLLEIEGTKLRNAINQQNAQMLEAQQAQAQQQYNQQLADMNAERTKQINQSLEIINKADNIYGLEISQAEKAEFGEFFGKLVTPDESGNAPMFQMLQENETLVKVAMMLWKGDDKIRAALTNAKESGKEAVLNKLDKKPNTPAKGGGQGDPNKVDLDALSAPEKVQW